MRTLTAKFRVTILFLSTLVFFGSLPGCGPSQMNGQSKQPRSLSSDNPDIIDLGPLEPYHPSPRSYRANDTVGIMSQMQPVLYSRQLVIKVDKLADQRQEKKLMFGYIQEQRFRLSREPDVTITRYIQNALDNYFLLSRSEDGNVTADASPDLWLRGSLTGIGFVSVGDRSSPMVLPYIDFNLAIYDRFGHRIQVPVEKYEKATWSPPAPIRLSSDAHSYSFLFLQGITSKLSWIDLTIAEEVYKALSNGSLKVDKNNVMSDLSLSIFKQQYDLKVTTKKYEKSMFEHNVSDQRQQINSNYEILKIKKFLTTDLKFFKKWKNSVSLRSKLVVDIIRHLEELIRLYHNLADTASKSDALNKAEMDQLIASTQEKINKAELVLENCRALQLKLLEAQKQ